VGWDAIRGHDAPRGLFDRAWEQQRLAHAYLLVGAGGIGKAMFARELARALLCEARLGPGLVACGRCDACAQVAIGSHPDLHLLGMLEDRNEFTVDQMREAGEEMRLKPMRGGYRVLILANADRLNPEAGNCFLKTLEEPPPRTLQLLLSGSADILRTIRSRCQVVRFTPPSAEDFAEILTANGVTGAATIERLGRITGNSPGLALTLNDPDLWEFRQRLMTGLARERVDAIDLGNAWVEFCAAAGTEAPPRRKRARLVLRLLLDFLSDALRVQQGAPAVRSGPEDEKLLAEVGRVLTPEAIVALLDRTMQAETQIARYVPHEIVLEGLLDAWAQQMAPKS